MTTETTAKGPQPDPFVQLSLDTWSGLGEAIRELGWIAEGGDPNAGEAERDEANEMRNEYARQRIRVMQRLMAYLAKDLTVAQPSDGDLQRSKAMATELAAMRARDVTVTAVVHAATELLKSYNAQA